MINWIETGKDILVAIGAFLGGGWILNFYNAKPKKNAIEIENMKQAIEELGAVIEQLSKNNKEYKREIDDLRKEVTDLSVRVNIKHEAIYASAKCPYIKSTDDCIVMTTFNEKCRKMFKDNDKV